ncbi:MAG: acyl--CoA ligase [Actinobacteria bacterium]|nr:acyl--CoA ligase [Actinomycetota bacterium]
MSESLAGFLLATAETRPDLRIGVVDGGLTLREAVDAGLRVAGALEAAGLGPGARIAIVEGTSDAWFAFWIGCQLAGVETALVNPSYPPDLLAKMMRRLEPAAVATASGEPPRDEPAATRRIGFGGAAGGALTIDGVAVAGEPSDAAGGLARGALETAGYMHTSGTSGPPKFCAQSHRYFLRLARFIADTFCLSPADVVFAPLPAFHVNPLGYGFLGALAGLADTRTTSRFSASSFWPAACEVGATVLVLHGPPVEILKRRTDGADAAGHRVRAAFLGDQEFLTRFGVPLSFSGYGSTEAAGLCHAWTWRRGEPVELPEGMTRLGGRPRHDVEWELAPDGEIRVREREPGVLFSGYMEHGRLEPVTDADGWFATGDLGRRDDDGRLVFIERRSDSVRVKGEYVPLMYVEAAFAEADGVADVAAWKRPGELGDDELVLYVIPAADELPLDAIRAAAARLPAFMRPAAVGRITEIPRDPGIRKVQRRRLDADAASEWVEL